MKLWSKNGVVLAANKRMLAQNLPQTMIPFAKTEPPMCDVIVGYAEMLNHSFFIIYYWTGGESVYDFVGSCSLQICDVIEFFSR